MAREHRTRAAASGRARLVAAAALAVSALAAAPGSYAERLQGTTERVSVADGGRQVRGGSRQAAISANGRFVAFASTAPDLVPGDHNETSDIFVRDRLADTTVRVSVSSAGVEADGWSIEPAISADGRYVAFTSTASNLAPGVRICDQPWGVTPCGDLYVHDRETGTTRRASPSTTGEGGNGFSRGAALSADGRFVAFASEASNLVDGDGNGQWDVFVRDLEADATVRISLAPDGADAAGRSVLASISADGRFVSFSSTAANLVAEDDNEWHLDVFVRDRDADGDGIYDEPGAVTTEIVSRATDGTQANSDSIDSDLSPDGRWVAFRTVATNLTPGPPPQTCNTLRTALCTEIYLHDRLTGVTTRVSEPAWADEPIGICTDPRVSADGRFVAFKSNAPNLVAHDVNDSSDIFLRDMHAGETTIVSLTWLGTQGDFAARPDMTPDARFVTFDSNAHLYVPDDTNLLSDVFLRDRQGAWTPNP